MDEQSLKKIKAAEMNRREEDMTWVIEMIMSDYPIDEIMDRLMKKARAYRKEKKYVKTEIRTENPFRHKN